MRPRFGGDALPVAFSIAALWVLHPLQTEAVSYVVQRAESLMGLFYLLTLYGFVRNVQSPSPTRWQVFSVASGLLGMATKENMASAPVLVLLLDRALVAGSFAEAWRRRRAFYSGLAATWILLVALIASTGGNRGGSAGFGIAVSWWDYVLTQFSALVHYVWLSFWPQPLVFDYGTFGVRKLADVWPEASVVTLLVAGVPVALWRRPVLGFFDAWFFAMLAPTSLMPGTTQQIVEHRMYLSLAPVVVLVVTCGWMVGGRRVLALLGVMAAGLSFLTFHRNADYRSEIALWRDTVTKRPGNSAAHAGLGAALANNGHPAEAIVEDRAALQLRPDYAIARSNLGIALISVGRPAEAVQELEKSLLLLPDDFQAHLNMGVALDWLQRTPEALPHFETAVRLSPRLPLAHNNLGDALSRSGRNEEGIAHLQTALQLDPDYFDAHRNLAAALARAGRLDGARIEFEAVRRLKTDDAEAEAHWAGVLLTTGHPTEALSHFATVVRLRPDSATEHYNYASALAGANQLEEAVPEFEAALRLKPDYADAHNNLGNTLTLLRREAEALPHYEAVLRLRPDHPPAHNNLGLALARLGCLPEAAVQFAEAVRLAPGYEEARGNLARAQEQLRAAPP